MHILNKEIKRPNVGLEDQGKLPMTEIFKTFLLIKHLLYKLLMKKKFG